MDEAPTPRTLLRMRSVFISDVHLGFKGCQAAYLLDFLRRAEFERIYLIGILRWTETQAVVLDGVEVPLLDSPGLIPVAA